MVVARALLCGFLVVGISGCKRAAPSEGEAPPPVPAAATANVCHTKAAPVLPGGIGEVFIAQVSDLCLDPNGEPRVYGEGQAEPLDAVCLQLFNGECELYKTFGLRRVAAVRYVDGRGTAAAVSVNLSRFSSSEGAFAFFTRRVVGNADPKELPFKTLDAGASAALGTGVAYVWKATQVLELSYTNETEAPEQVRASAARLLPQLGRALGDRLTGETVLPESARRLPANGLLHLGVRYEIRDAFDVPGLGAGAVGYYDDAGKRYRIFLSVNPDPNLAKDMIRSLRRLPGLRTLKEAPHDAFELHGAMSPESPVTQWVIGRNEQVVAGVGDEPLAVSAAANAEAREALSLTPEQKLEMLRKLLR
jgi:hypothetical protein